MIKSFPVPVLASITTGRLLCLFGDMHEAIEHVAGRPVWTHELASKALVDSLRDRLIAQHPALTGAEAVTARWAAIWRGKSQSEISADIASCNAEIVALLGETLAVESGTPGPMDNSALVGKEIVPVVL